MDQFRWPNEYVNWNDDLLKQCCQTIKCYSRKPKAIGLTPDILSIFENKKQTALIHSNKFVSIILSMALFFYRIQIQLPIVFSTKFVPNDPSLRKKTLD